MPEERRDNQLMIEGEAMAVLTWALRSQMGEVVTLAVPAGRSTKLPGFRGLVVTEPIWFGTYIRPNPRRKC